MKGLRSKLSAKEGFRVFRMKKCCSMADCATVHAGDGTRGKMERKRCDRDDKQ